MAGISVAHNKEVSKLPVVVLSSETIMAPENVSLVIKMTIAKKNETPSPTGAVNS